MDPRQLPPDTQALLARLVDEPTAAQAHHHPGFRSATTEHVQYATPEDGWDHAFTLVAKGPRLRNAKNARFVLSAARLSRSVPPVVFQADPRSVMVDADETIVRLPSMKAVPKANQPLHAAWRIWVNDDDAEAVLADQYLLAAAVGVTPPKFRRKLPQRWADWLAPASKEEEKLLKAAARGFLSLFFVGPFVYVVQRWGLPNRVAVAGGVASMVSQRGI